MAEKKQRLLSESGLKKLAEKIIAELEGHPDLNKVYEKRRISESSTTQLRDYLNARYGLFDVRYHFEDKNKFGVAHICWLNR